MLSRKDCLLDLNLKKYILTKITTGLPICSSHPLLTVGSNLTLFLCVVIIIQTRRFVAKL